MHFDIDIWSVNMADIQNKLRLSLFAILNYLLRVDFKPLVKWQFCVI